MSKNPPAAFLLVSQAALCSPGHIDYRQLHEEVSAGRLRFDPLLSHEGVWLLDHAIICRLKSDGGQREFRKNKSADPAMDALWNQWLIAATPELLGSADDQSHRAARLAQLGCRVSLDTAISNGLTPGNIQTQWDQHCSPALRSNLFSRVIKEDLRGTVAVLLKHGFAKERYALRDHPLVLVKSASVMQMLLDAGMDPKEVGTEKGSLIDITSARSLSSDDIIAIVQVLRDSGKVPDESAARLSRISNNLEKKTLPQLRSEMRAANWSPSKRGLSHSPIISWARKCIEAPSLLPPAGSGLSWLSKQGGVSIAQPGQKWSEAVWLWAAYMASSPACAFEFAPLAADMPTNLNRSRFSFLRSFLLDEDLSLPYLERAVDKSIQNASYNLSRDNKAACELLDCLFQQTDGTSWVLGAYVAKSDRIPDIRALLESFISCGDQPQNISRCMSLGLIVASLHEDGDLLSSIDRAWSAGLRPLDGPNDRSLVSSRLAGIDPEMAARVQAWDMSHATPPVRHSPRTSRL